MELFLTIKVPVYIELVSNLIRNSTDLEQNIASLVCDIEHL